MPKAKKISNHSNKRLKTSDDSKNLKKDPAVELDNEKKDLDEEGADKDVILGEQEKTIDPDLLEEEDVVTGFGVEGEDDEENKEEEDDETVSEEVYDPFGDRFEQ